ncbi:MAG: hypothetical protein EOO42_11380 [Flavobacteriales bacterium]|nr:MAG: hypothetical protein EOO42_11380 [Flavobacteriales bacterium]
MKSLLSKDVKPFLIAFVFSTFFFACKKEVVEVKIDAFAQLNPEIKSEKNIYNVLFTLQEYPYKEVGLRLSKNKSSFFSGNDLSNFVANEVSKARYGVFINGLASNQVYYYQIYVKDSKATIEVYSDVLSFKTNP